jgi:Uma2 family endonuclease
MVTTTRPLATAPSVVPARVRYPESDGQPVGETDFHITAIFYLRWALRRYLRDQTETYVAADMMLYYEEGNPQAVRSPDVFVVRGVSRHDRRTYLLWEEGVPPCVVIEMTSASSRLEELGNKRVLYEMLGVAEYYVFDPLGEYLVPRLQGFQLVNGRYQSMPPEPDGALLSAQLGVRLLPDGALLRVVDPATGEAIPTSDEAMEMAEAEAERARSEAQRADAAEGEVTRLQVELARLRSGGASE